VPIHHATSANFALLAVQSLARAALFHRCCRLRHQPAKSRFMASSM